MTIQTSCLSKLFTIWAKFVSKCTLVTMVLSLALLAFIVMSGFFMDDTEFEDESKVWTPEGNLSLVSRELADKLFGTVYETRYLSFIFEAKRDDGSILTKDCLQEMIQFEHDLFRIS